MLGKHPKKYMVGYIILCLWNVWGVIQPGGPPTWMSATAAGVMGIMAIVSYRISKRGRLT